MKRTGHLGSEPKTAVAPPQGRRQPRRYGPTRIVFNAFWLGVATSVAMVCTIAANAMTNLPTILDLGDSLTAGYGLMPEQAFPARLEAWLRAHGIAARVVNAGVSGDTTAGGLARLDWALADKPDLVILALGANDALRGVPPATVRSNLDKMLEKIEATRAKVLILGMLAPPNLGEEYARVFNAIYPELARTHHAALYPFFLEGVAMKRDLNQPDGLHPNARGVEVLVERIGPVVARLIVPHQPHQGGAS